MKITARWLKSKGACAEQVALFKKRYPNGIDSKHVTSRVVWSAARGGLRVEWLVIHISPASRLTYGNTEARAWGDWYLRSGDLVTYQETKAAALAAAIREGL